MYNDVKLLACDIDGTIMNNKNELTQRTRQALSDVAESGINLVISTGRSYNAIDPNLTNIKGIKYAIVSNGAAIYDIEEKEFIYKDELSLSTAISIVKAVMKFDVCVAVFVGPNAYTTKKIYKNPVAYGVKPHMLEYFKGTRVPVDDIINFLEEKQEPVGKIFLLLKECDDKSRIIQELSEYKDAFITSSGENNVEIVNKSADKSTALEFLAKKLDIDKKYIMAAGDSPNDIGMLKASGTRVVMGNGFDEVKKIADIVADTNDNDGLAKVLEQYILKK